MKSHLYLFSCFLITLALSISCQSRQSENSENPMPSKSDSQLAIMDLHLPSTITDQGRTDQAETDQAVTDQGIITNDQMLPTGATCETPPKVQLRRLSRFEYERSLRVYFSYLADQVAQNLPEDGVGYGFDQIGEVLSLTPLHLEKYQLVLEEILSKFFQTSLKTDIFEAAQLEQTTGASYHGTSWQYWREAQVELFVKIEIDGQYEWEIQSQNLSVVPTLSQKISTTENQWQDVENLQVSISANGYLFKPTLSKGQYRLKLTLNPTTEIGDQIGILDEIRVFGPTPIPTDLLVREQVLPCRFNAKERAFWMSKLGQVQNINQNDSVVDENQINWQCLSQSLLKLAQSAWRKSLTTAEQNRLLAWTSDQLRADENWAEAFKATAQLIFLSPNFIFKTEPANQNAEDSSLLTDEQIATRMAYFLWSSPPNEWLYTQAHQGLLRDPVQRREIAQQMMADVHADALIESFADQWLHIRNLKNVAPDLNVFPSFSEDLRQSMALEMKLTIKDLLLRNASLDELLISKYRILDQNLAIHYGLDWQQLSQIQATQIELQTFENHPDLQRDLDRLGFIKIDLQSLTDLNLRKGLLGLSGFLTITSMPNRTSPVKRGKWVLEELLCTPPPPPPANVEANLNAVTEGRTLKEKLEAHRADPACMGCHQLMDPIGLGLESYDGIGRFRTQENGVPIEASGQLIDGSTFNGVEELSAHLIEDRRFARCFVERVYTFALGRGPQDADDCHLKVLRDRFIENQLQIKDLLLDMIASPAFATQKQE